jgi:hypothetical protein
MNTISRGQILVTRVDDPVYNAICNVLSPLGFDIHRAPWNDYLDDHVQITPFDVIITGFSAQRGAMERFFKALRTRGSACHHSGVVLIASAERMELAESLVGRGANKVVSEREVGSRLQDAVSQLIGVAPRVPVTTNARIKIYVDDKPIQSFFQTLNLSATGALVRGFGHYPTGTKIDFEINLPDGADPIRGAGVISRRTRKQSERVDGLGIKFTSFHGTDQKRLAEFLATTELRNSKNKLDAMAAGHPEGGDSAE